jgi:hypothetical protein
MEQTWVKAKGSLLHDTRYDDPDKLAVTLWKNHEFPMKTAYLAATTLPSVNTPANKDELMKLWTAAMTRQSGWKGHERVTLPRLAEAVKRCTSEIAGAHPRAMTEDPITGIPLDERPNMRTIQLPQESVGYILGKGGNTLRGLQEKSGATCFLDENAATPTIRCWGVFTAVEQLDTEIKQSVMYQRARAGKDGKGGAGGYPHNGLHGKGQAGMNSPYGKGAMKGHGKGGMHDQHAFNGGNYGAWQGAW